MEILNIINTIIKEGGLNAAILVLVVYVVIDVLKQQRAILEQAAQERIIWSNTIKQISEIMTIHTEHAKQFQEAVSQAHVFQRDEHNKMLDGFNAFCLKYHGNAKECLDTVKRIEECVKA